MSLKSPLGRCLIGWAKTPMGELTNRNFTSSAGGRGPARCVMVFENNTWVTLENWLKIRNRFVKCRFKPNIFNITPSDQLETPRAQISRVPRVCVLLCVPMVPIVLESLCPGKAPDSRKASKCVHYETNWRQFFLCLSSLPIFCTIKCHPKKIN